MKYSILRKNTIYSFYTIQSHIDAGNYMILSGIIMMFVILPLVIIKKALQYILDKFEKLIKLLLMVTLILNYTN